MKHLYKLPRPCLRTLYAVSVLTLCAVSVLTLCASCASFAPPNQRLVDSEASIARAHEAGAKDVPKAALHLKLAEEQTDKARDLMKEADNQRADWLLMQAQVDADYAAELARNQRATDQAEQAKKQVETTKEQLQP